MISKLITNREARRELIMHFILALVWIALVVVAIIYRGKLTWVFGITAVSYIAIDEIINVFFAWRDYSGRIPKVSEEVTKETAKEE